MRRLVFYGVFTLLLVYAAAKLSLALPARAHALWVCAVLSLLTAWAWPWGTRSAYAGRPWARAIVWAGAVSLGVWASFLFFSLWIDVAALALALLGLRGLFAPWLPGALLGASGALSAAGLAQALSGPRVREVDLPIEGLPEALRDLRVAHLTDLHVGPTVRREYVENVVGLVSSLKPDLIAFTGDVADGRPDELAEHVAPLARLRAPLGAYVVTGNHEYYWGAPAWLAAFEGLGLTPLVNEGRVVEKGGAKLLVAGVPDSSAYHFVPEHAMDVARAAKDSGGCAVRLLLAHRPDACERAEPAGFDVQLSGHTHGGQFFPWTLLIRFFHTYYRGLNRHGRMWVYVNPGTGYWGPPHRFGVPSEITLLRLVAA